MYILLALVAVVGYFLAAVIAKAYYKTYRWTYMSDDIDYVLDYLNELFGGKMKAEELGCDGEYGAIFFFKKDQEYRSLVKEWKASHEEVEDDES